MPSPDQKFYDAERYRERESNGVCVLCGKGEHMSSGKKTCELCREKIRKRAKLKKLRDKRKAKSHAKAK